jgi:hypothetical protein
MTGPASAEPAPAPASAGSAFTAAPTQQQEQQQQQPREPPITLARAPLRTLYYFAWSVASGLRDAAHFVATHPLTLFMALPLLAYYVTAKALGYAPAHTALMEVRAPAGRRPRARMQRERRARLPWCCATGWGSGVALCTAAAAAVLWPVGSAKVELQWTAAGRADAVSPRDLPGGQPPGVPTPG